MVGGTWWVAPGGWHLVAGTWWVAPGGWVPFAHGVHLEAYIFERSVFEMIRLSKRRLADRRVTELVIWVRLELIPHGELNKRVSSSNTSCSEKVCRSELSP